MRLLLALIIIIYLVGVGVVLSPVVRQTWNTEPASVVAGDIGQAAAYRRQDRLGISVRMGMHRLEDGGPGPGHSQVGHTQPGCVIRRR